MKVSVWVWLHTGYREASLGYKGMLNGHGQWANLGPAQTASKWGNVYCAGCTKLKLHMSWQWWWWTFAPILQNLAKTWQICLEWIFWGTWHVCVTCPSQVGGPDCTHVTFSSNCRQHCRRSLQFRFNPALPEAQASLTETLFPIVLWVNCHVQPYDIESTIWSFWTYCNVLQRAHCGLSLPIEHFSLLPCVCKGNKVVDLKTNWRRNWV